MGSQEVKGEVMGVLWGLGVVLSVKGGGSKVSLLESIATFDGSFVI